MISRIVLILAILALPFAAAAQQFGKAEFPLKADDGDPMTNHSLTAAQMAEVGKLSGVVNVGDPNGDVALYQFYDLNCPFCREAAHDVDDLAKGDKKLKLIFVPYPVLSVKSVEGARVELALRELATPQQFFEFHRKLYAGRGVIDGNRALGVAQDMGFDQTKIIAIANTQDVTATMTAHARLGSTLKLIATPSYVIQGVAILGHPGLKPLQQIVASVRRCKKVMC